MAERPKPTKPLLLELCGGNQGLISSAHHGLYESNLSEIYPQLDLDEAIAFAVSSFKGRERDSRGFARMVEENDLYGIFNNVFSIGMPWLNKYKQISSVQETKHSKLNPYHGSNLRERLERVSPESTKRLKGQLKDTVNEYVFDCQYRSRKAARGGDNYKLEIMNFQPVFPRSGVIVPNFCAEVARMISGYSSEYTPLEH